MRKYISFLILSLFLAVGMTSCDVDTNVDAGGTAVQKMSGFWDVHAYALDDATGKVLSDLGDFRLWTYNTADNVSDKMWVDDQDNFWGMKMVVDVNYKGRSFQVAAPRPYANGESETATITDGKVLEKAGKNVHGAPCDSIVFTVKFSDNKLEKQGGQHTYRVAGIRHYGFSPENE